VRVRNHDDLASVVTESIGRIEGIQRTQTLVAFKVYSRLDVESLFSLGFNEESG
jgi:DNA-binding Lrp family transcriptional regulator